MDEDAKQDVERWQRIEEIYHAALSLTMPERQAFVAHASAGDAALCGEVMSLLAADDKAAEFLQEPAFSLGLGILADEDLQDDDSLSESTQTSAIDPMIGLIVGQRYEIVKKLGHGGMGDVFLARDKPEMLCRTVVIKVLREERLADKWVVAKFKQEAEALTKIDDPGVVGILDAGTLSGGKPFLVMQYVEGQALSEYLKSKRAKQEEVELQEVAEIVQQVGRTLHAAHQAGIIHRDLKPDNIMLRRNVSGDLQVKVIDFGIAKVKNSALASSTETVYLAGTWQYMSPEQLRREKVTPLSDIYALSVITYEMLTGRRPFNAKDPVQLAEFQRAGVKVAPRDLRLGDVSEAAQQIILKALSYRPDERYQSAREFGHEVALALRAEMRTPVPFSPAPADLEASTLDAAPRAASASVVAATGIQPSARPRTHMFWLAASTVALLAGLLSLVLWLRSQPPPSSEHMLTYWLEARMCIDRQKQCQDEKTAEFSNPIVSTGEEIFNNGSKIRFHFLPEQTGFLYLFNKGPVNDGAAGWYVLFPHPVQNNSNAQLPAGREFPTLEHGPLDKRNGIEEVWIIWSARPVPELENISRAAFDNRGKILEPTQQDTLSAFFNQHVVSASETIRVGGNMPRVILKGSREILVGFIKIRHEDY